MIRIWSPQLCRLLQEMKSCQEGPPFEWRSGEGNGVVMNQGTAQIVASVTIQVTQAA